MNLSTTAPYSNTPLFSRWVNMKQRCYNTKNTSYKDYGGRGITVCKEWRDSFFSFREWAISNGYSGELRIDRKDNNGMYEPSNCRWVTESVNQNNKRSNIKFRYLEGEATLTEISNITKVNHKTLWHRIFRQGMKLDEAIDAGKRKPHPRRANSMMKRCEDLGISYNAVKIRKSKYKISEEEAIKYYTNVV